MDVPDNCFIAWEARKTGAHPLNQRSSVGVLGFRSASPLLGGALFDVRLPTAAVGMYIGIKEWQGTRRSYVRIDNIFQANTTWSFGINDLPARPHFGREKFQILPTNRFQITWGSKFFSVMLNGAGVSTLKLPNTNLTAAPVLSELFVWVFARPSPREQDATVRPLPSLMQLDADIPCSICQVSSRVARRGCAVCPRCCTWVCRRHVQEEPLRPCRRCPAMLGDYLGGSEPVGDIVRPYIDAGSFWLSVQTEAAGDCGKFDLVIHGILRRHTSLLQEIPDIVALLPDPSQRACVSKRRWESLLHRARTVLDLLEQNKHKTLFLYLHALTAESQPLPDISALWLLSDPESDQLLCPSAWRAHALQAALRVQLAMDFKTKQASDSRNMMASAVAATATSRPCYAQRTLDYCGGAESVLVQHRDYFRFECYLVSLTTRHAYSVI